jgi:anti-sigma-K factor RskA
MSDLDHESRREELASYLLGALEPGEAAELERHLAGCGECRAELDRLRPAVQVLPDSVERRQAPPQLRDRIVSEVRADDVARSQAARGRRLSIPLRPALGFATVLLIGIAVAGYAIRDGDSTSETTTVVAGSPPGVTVKMVREGDSGTLRLAHLRKLPPGRVLQTWVSRGGQVEAAGAPFEPTPAGTALAAIDDMSGVDAVMVTAEPRGGSASPSSAPLISVAVRQ